MGSTPRMLLPYPELTEPADVPADMRELSERLAYVVCRSISAGASGALTLTTTATDIPGCAASFAVDFSTVVLFQATLDVEITTAGVGICVVDIVLDGAVVGQSFLSLSSTGRLSVSATALRVVASSHTFKLRASKTLGAGVARVNTAVFWGLLT